MPNPEERADKKIDSDLSALERKIADVYKTAYDELDEKVRRYQYGYYELVEDENGNFQQVRHLGMYERYAEQLQAFESGQWRDKDGNVVTDPKVFDKWWYAQEGRKEHWTDLRDQMADRLTEANVTAERYINNKLPNVYATASNSVAKVAEASAKMQGIGGLRFEMVDEYTVRNLVTDKKKVFKFDLVKIDTTKDNAWNAQKLQNALLQGVLQGDDIYDIAKRFRAVENMNKTSAIRNARTALTSARNAGKQARWEDLEEQGVIMTKVWEDVHDSIPPEREAHWEASGQEVPVNEPFIVGDEELMFPGDTSLGASGWNIYNCRCRSVTGRMRFKSRLTKEQKANAKIKIYDNKGNLRYDATKE